MRVRLTHQRLVVMLAMVLPLVSEATAGGATARNAEQPKPDSAALRIETHYTAIDNRFRDMNILYTYGSAVQTLRDAFQRQRITRSTESATNWGNNGLWLAWEPAQVFYRYHRTALAESLNAIQGVKVVSADDLDYLERGMQAWQEHERQLEKLFQESVAVYVRLASSFDKKAALQDRYNEQRAAARQGKNFDRVEALNREEGEALKPLKAEEDRLYQSRDKLRGEIEELARTRLFEAIKARADNPRTTSRGPTTNPRTEEKKTNPRTEEKRKPEPLVRTGRAPGARAGERP